MYSWDDKTLAERAGMVVSFAVAIYSAVMAYLSY